MALNFNADDPTLTVGQAKILKRLNPKLKVLIYSNSELGPLTHDATAVINAHPEVSNAPARARARARVALLRFASSCPLTTDPSTARLPPLGLVSCVERSNDRSGGAGTMTATC